MKQKLLELISNLLEKLLKYDLRRIAEISAFIIMIASVIVLAWANATYTKLVPYWVTLK